MAESEKTPKSRAPPAPLDEISPADEARRVPGYTQKRLPNQNTFVHFPPSVPGTPQGLPLTTPHWMKPNIVMPLPSPTQLAPRGVSSFSPARLIAIPPAPPKPNIIQPLATPSGFQSRRVDFLSPVASPAPPPNFAYSYPVALPQNPYTAAPMLPGFGIGGAPAVAGGMLPQPAMLPQP
jgi:hypothetical protein